MTMPRCPSICLVQSWSLSSIANCRRSNLECRADTKALVKWPLWGPPLAGPENDPNDEFWRKRSNRKKQPLVLCFGGLLCGAWACFQSCPLHPPYQKKAYKKILAWSRLQKDHNPRPAPPRPKILLGPKPDLKFTKRDCVDFIASLHINIYMNI